MKPCPLCGTAFRESKVYGTAFEGLDWCRVCNRYWEEPWTTQLTALMQKQREICRCFALFLHLVCAATYWQREVAYNVSFRARSKANAMKNAHLFQYEEQKLFLWEY